MFISWVPADKLVFLFPQEQEHMYNCFLKYRGKKPTVSVYNSLYWPIVSLFDVSTGWQWWDPVVGGAGYAEGALPLPKGV